MKIYKNFTSVTDAALRVENRDGFPIFHDINIARTGYQQYRADELMENPEDPKAIINVFRASCEVFDTDALQSFENIPLTYQHPQDFVTIDSHNELSKGFAYNINMNDDKTHVTACIKVTDVRTARMLEENPLQLSVGYGCELLEKNDLTDAEIKAIKDVDGVDLQDGDFLQTNIVGNHLALVEKSRCGATCTTCSTEDTHNKISDNETTDKETVDMEYENTEEVNKFKDTLIRGGIITATMKKVKDNELAQASDSFSYSMKSAGDAVDGMLSAFDKDMTKMKAGMYEKDAVMSRMAEDADKANMEMMKKDKQIADMQKALDLATGRKPSNTSGSKGGSGSDNAMEDLDTTDKKDMEKEKMENEKMDKTDKKDMEEKMDKKSMKEEMDKKDMEEKMDKKSMKEEMDKKDMDEKDKMDKKSMKEEDMDDEDEDDMKKDKKDKKDKKATKDASALNDAEMFDKAVADEVKKKMTVFKFRKQLGDSVNEEEANLSDDDSMRNMIRKLGDSTPLAKTFMESILTDKELESASFNELQKTLELGIKAKEIRQDSFSSVQTSDSENKKSINLHEFDNREVATTYNLSTSAIENTTH